MKTYSSIRFFFLALLVMTMACARSFRATPNPTTDAIHSITFDGLERTYILHIPVNYIGEDAVPLVLDFHGGGGNANSEMSHTGFRELADKEGFIVAFPNGNGRFEDKLLTWNGGTCCGYSVTNNIDDVGFTRALITEIEASYKIDPKKIYATGLSNGAIFSYRLACDASDIFAAIGPVAGTLNYVRCNPEQSVSVIHFHGTEDSHVGYDGGAGPDSLVDVPFASVKDSINLWVNKDQCSQIPETESFSDIKHDTYSGCVQETAIELYTIIGGKHAWPGSGAPAWPGGDEPTGTISATELMWKFFIDHPKP